MRTFLALDMPEEALEALERLQERLTVGREVPADDFHLTLVFLGDATLDQLEELHGRLDMMVFPDLSIVLRGVDVFGAAVPRSLHVTVDGGAALDAFHRKLAGYARAAGIHLPHRRFVPHVTLARFRDRMPEEDLARVGRFLQAHGAWKWPAFVPPALSLYRSHLSAEGARYERLESYGPLALPDWGNAARG